MQDHKYTESCAQRAAQPASSRPCPRPAIFSSYNSDSPLSGGVHFSVFPTVRNGKCVVGNELRLKTTNTHTHTHTHILKPKAPLPSPTSLLPPLCPFSSFRQSRKAAPETVASSDERFCSPA